MYLCVVAVAAGVPCDIVGVKSCGKCLIKVLYSSSNLVTGYYYNYYSTYYSVIRCSGSGPTGQMFYIKY